MATAPTDLNYNLPLNTLQGQANQFQNLNGSPEQAIGQLGTNYANAYNSATALNQGIYQGTQTGYNNLRNQLSQQYGDITAQYQKNYGDVLGQIAGTNATNLKDISTQYGALAGSSMQDAVSRGLGNTTVQQNMQRGIALDQARATTASQNQFAQLQAGYQSQEAQGLSQLGQQGAQTQAQLGQNQLNFGASVSAPYPNAGLYGQLAQMYGAQNEADKNRALQQKAMQAVSARQPVGAGATGNQLSPFSGPQMNYGASGGGGGFFGGGGYAQAYTPQGPGWLTGNGTGVAASPDTGEANVYPGGPQGAVEQYQGGSDEGQSTPYSSGNYYSGGYGGTGDYGYDPASYG